MSHNRTGGQAGHTTVRFMVLAAVSLLLADFALALGGKTARPLPPGVVIEPPPHPRDDGGDRNEDAEPDDDQRPGHDVPGCPANDRKLELIA